MCSVKSTRLPAFSWSFVYGRLLHDQILQLLLKQILISQLIKLRANGQGILQCFWRIKTSPSTTNRINTEISVFIDLIAARSCITTAAEHNDSVTASMISSFWSLLLLQNAEGTTTFLYSCFLASAIKRHPFFHSIHFTANLALDTRL